MKRMLRYFKRKLDSISFWMRNPSCIKMEVYNPKAIAIGKNSRVDFYSRLFVMDPDGGGRIELANNVWIGRNVELQVRENQKIVLEPRVSVQDFCKILGDVFIGQDTTIAPNVFISSGSHQFDKEPLMPIKDQDKKYPFKSQPVKIGKDVWIGINVFIKAGVTVGDGVIIGANSVVTSDLENYSIYAGIPAKKIKSRL